MAYAKYIASFGNYQQSITEFRNYGIVPKLGDIFLNTIYERIEGLCKKAQINITIMCKESGVPRSALSDYKAGRTKSLSADKLSKIASYFGVSVDYLLGNEKKEGTPAGEHDILDDADIAFYNRYTSLNEDEKEDMRDFLNLIEARRKRRERDD